MPKTDSQLILPRCRVAGTWSPATTESGQSRPLLVAIHGAGYRNTYFDIAGASLVQAGNLAGFHVFSVDRPDHGATPALPAGANLIERNALHLCDAVDELLASRPDCRRQVVLVGHSVGGAIAIRMAAQTPDWLAGVAVSGIGCRPDPLSQVMSKFLPPTRKFDVNPWLKQRLMFGKAGSYDPRMARASIKEAGAGTVRQELAEIYGWWPGRVAEIAAKVRVPVDCTLGDGDRTWGCTAADAATFGKLFSGAASVRSDIVADAGHCIDHHKVGPAFHQRQLAFAQRCCGVGSA